VKKVALACVCLLPCLTLAQEPADIVLRGGAVYTVDSSRTWAQAVAISGNEIVFVGLDAGVEDYIGDETKVIDLDGKMVLPGFQDSHIHPVSSSLKSYMCSLYGLPGRDAYIEKVRECVEEHGDAEWIHGSGWSHAYFPEGDKPTKFMLDEIISDKPLTLTSYDGHSLWANSKALEIAGVDEDTPDVSFGEVVRLPGGTEPSGLLTENDAQNLVLNYQPPYTDQQVYDALISVQKYLNSLGVTSIQDAIVDISDDGIYGVHTAYERAAAEGSLTLRVVAALYWNSEKGLEQIDDFKALRERSSGMFRATSVKIWYDGVMHTHTSRLLEDYADKPGERGMTMFTREELYEMVTALDKEGFQVHFHADGDGAIRDCLDAVEHAVRVNGRGDARHHIAHLELIHPDDIVRFRDLGVVANVQPIWSTSKYYIGDLIDVKIGEERAPWLEINNSFLDAGVITAYGSDWYVTSPNPMDLIEAAVTRIRPSLPRDEKEKSQPILPGEEVSVADAIASYTINGAYVNHQEDTTGSIEVGKLADIVVLDKNIFDVSKVQISETKVLLTLMDGKIVFDELTVQPGS
jgi:predicted amidohydrolase YtcJ